MCSRHRVGGREQTPTSSADCSPRGLVQPGTCTTARLAQETQLPQLQEASWLEEESIPCSAFISSAIKEIFIECSFCLNRCTKSCRKKIKRIFSLIRYLFTVQVGNVNLTWEQASNLNPFLRVSPINTGGFFPHWFYSFSNSTNLLGLLMKPLKSK